MAGFQTHLRGALVVSTAASFFVYTNDLVAPDRIPFLFVLGVLGGLLPDVDADDSRVARPFFTLLGVGAAFFCTSYLRDQPPTSLIASWVGVFLLVRVLCFELFSRLTRHRGLWHSWLGMFLCGVATANTAHHVLGLDPLLSWLAACCLALGYLTHLFLDELYSVDLRGNRIKRSFGSALKPLSFANPGASLSMLGLVVALSIHAPSLRPLLDLAADLLAAFGSS